MKITIYNPDATVFKEVVLLDGSMMTNGIRDDHDVTLCFSSEEELAIPEGAYVVFNGETFIAKSKSKMEMSHTRSYTYTVKMNGAPSALSSVRLRNPADGKLSFPYTASAHDHLALIVSNMNRYGGGGWSVGDCIDGGDKFLQYNYISCRDALDSLADTYGTEWEIVGKTISLHKVEYNLDSPLELSYGKGSGLRPGVIRDNVQTPMTRLYTQGGSKNIDASEYGSTTLLLPKSVTFKYDGNKFEDEQGFDETKARIYSTDSEGTYIKSHKNEGRDVNEGVIDCTDIYPNKLHTVLEVESGDNPREIVLDIDENLDYSQYQIAGEVPTITFQSGELMGKTFEIRRDQGGVIMVSKKYSEQGSFIGWGLTLSGTFESGRWLPDTQSGLVPSVGDTCRIFGVRMPSQYISNNDTKSGASWDMLRRGIMYLYEYEDYIYSLKMPVDPIWARANWSSMGSKFVAGGYVRYSNSGWAQGGVVMRIKTIRQDISKPYSIEISLSNGIVGGGVLKGLSDSISNQAGSISEQQDTQKKLEYNVSSLSGNYITIDTEQTITAKKTFAEDVTFGAAKEDGSYARLLIPSSSGPGIYDLYVSTEPVDGEAPTASGGIDEDELWTILGTYGTKQIDPSHIPVIPVEKVSGLSTALSSYATQEWVEGKGYLTSVSLSTISDLHSSWDSLLQSAPDFYSKSSVYSKSEADGRFVGIANEQTITGRKTFSALLTASAGLSGTNADLSGYLCATKVYLPYSGGNKVYDILISTQPIDGEAPSEGGGINEEELWSILGGSGTQKIGVSHIPPLSELSGNLDSSRITGLDSALTGYVKKAGDTMTGALTLKGRQSDAFNSVGLLFTGNSGRIGTNTNNGLGIYAGGNLYLRPGSLSSASGKGVEIGTSLFEYNGYTVWHSGNDGSGSGLDADLLDGTQKSGLLTSVTSTSAANLSVTVGGTVKSVADLYATFLEGKTLAETRRGMSFLTSQFSAAGWYRVFTSIETNVIYSNEVILHIGRTYISPQNEHYTFSICVGYNGDISITQLSGVTGGRLITKIRVVWDNSKIFHIDIYSAASSYNNTYGVTGQGYGTFYAFTPNASIPSGYTSYEFTTVDGCKSDRGFTGGPGTFDTLRITNSTPAVHLAFGRSDAFNYISLPGDSSTLAIAPGGDIRGAGSALCISNSATYPGYHNGTISLGTSSYRWSNVYSVLGNFSGLVTADSIAVTDKLYIPSPDGNQRYYIKFE